MFVFIYSLKRYCFSNDIASSSHAYQTWLYGPHEQRWLQVWEYRKERVRSASLMPLQHRP
jgi:hypothetical protein